ncbi:MAG: hypothetical protein PHX74_12430 [Candidatus Sumerlaeales bacterium]|nr:hypothetical protein [Candidatus Sumerlaeales bacterium]
MTLEEKELWTWTKNNLKECPTRCGGELIKDNTIAFTSLPSKYRYVCSKCEYEEIAE